MGMVGFVRTPQLTYTSSSVCDLICRVYTPEYRWNLVGQLGHHGMPDRYSNFLLVEPVCHTLYFWHDMDRLRYLWQRTKRRQMLEAFLRGILSNVLRNFPVYGGQRYRQPHGQ